MFAPQSDAGFPWAHQRRRVYSLTTKARNHQEQSASSETNDKPAGNPVLLRLIYCCNDLFELHVLTTPICMPNDAENNPALFSFGESVICQGELHAQVPAQKSARTVYFPFNKAQHLKRHYFIHKYCFKYFKYL